MNTTDRCLTISSGISNQEISIAYGNQNLDIPKKSIPNKSIDSKKKLVDLSTDYCQDVFACLVCILLLNPDQNIFKENSSEKSLSTFLDIFLHYFYAPTKIGKNPSSSESAKKTKEDEKYYSKKTEKEIQRYEHKIYQSRKNIFLRHTNNITIDKAAFSTPFDRLCLDFSVLSENVKKSATKFILENLNEDEQVSVAAKLLNNVFYYHSQKTIDLEKKRFENFSTKLEKLCSKESNTNSLFGLFIKNKEKNKNYSVANIDGLSSYYPALDAVLSAYEKRLKKSKGSVSNLDLKGMLETIKDKINKGLINAEDFADALNRFNATNSIKVKNRILQVFLNRALLEKQDNSKLHDSCFRRSLFCFFVTSAVTLKMAGTLLLDSAFFFGVAFIFAGFDINFVQGSTTSIAISFGLAAITLAIWYSAGLATWHSRVDKIRKTISSASCFSDQKFEPESDEEEIPHPTLRKYMKRVLLYLIAPIAAIVSGLPAFYGVIKTISKLAGALGFHVSETQIFLIGGGVGVTFGSGIAFFCFYMFSVRKIIDEMVKKWYEKDKFFFFVTACFTLILGVVYSFSIRRALLELSEFLQGHPFKIFKMNNHDLANLIKHPAFFTVLFGCLMIVNFFSAIPRTAIMFTPSKPSVESKKKDGNDLTVFFDIERQASRKLFAQTKHHLGKRTKFKWSIALGDILAFSVIGSFMCSNSLLGNWNCTHVDKGKIIYESGTLGSDIMVLGSCSALLIAIAAIWYYRKAVGMSHQTAIISSLGLLMLTFTFLFYGPSTSLFFTGLVIFANMSVSVMFTHVPNIFPLGTKVEDEHIKKPSFFTSQQNVSEEGGQSMEQPLLSNKETQ